MTTCELEGCERPRGWGPYCKTHGRRNRLYGSPHVVKRSGVDFNTKGTCQQPGCDQPNKAREMCDTHYSRWQRHGDPTVVLPLEGRPPKTGVTGYHGAHKRVLRKRGPARMHTCVDCGGGATSWSYDNADPNELSDPEIGCAYSLDPEHYEPRCTSCHRKYDNAAGKRIRGADGRFMPGA